MTIRRDLTELERRQIIQRTHPGPTLFDASRLVYDLYTSASKPEKFRAEKPGRQLGCCAGPTQRDRILGLRLHHPFIAKHVDKEMSFTVPCYTFTNAIEFYPRPNTNQILLGGFFHRDSNIFHCPESLALIRNMRADNALVSTAGLGPNLDLTTIFYSEADR